MDVDQANLTWSRFLDVSIEDFRRLVGRLQNRRAKTWTSSNGTCLTFELSARMLKWAGHPTGIHVKVDPDSQDGSAKHCATIEILEHPDGVFLDVEDGVTRNGEDLLGQQVKPIGSPLREFVNHLINELAHPVAPIEPGLKGHEPLQRNRGTSLIHYEVFDGSLYDFHRLMLRLMNRCPEGWPPEGRKQLVFGKATVDPASYYFHYWVELEASVRRCIRPKPCARICIYPFSGVLVVDFQDSFDTREELPPSMVCPLGRLFEEFCRFVVDEIRSPLVPIRTPEPLKSLSRHAVARYDDIIHREPLLEDSSYPRGRMAGILHGCLKAWQSRDNPRLKLSTAGGPTDISLEKYWLESVTPLGDDTKQHACIVVERRGDPMVLNFLDGVGPPGWDDRQTEPIGQPFEEFCAFVVEAVRSGALASYDEPLDGDKKDDDPLLSAALFRGNLGDFRRLVDSLVCEDPDGWLAPDGTRLQLDLGSVNYGADGQKPYCWVQIAAVLERHHTGHYAALKAEEEDGQTVVTFRDGHRWKNSPALGEDPKSLGGVLEDFRKDIVKRMETFRVTKLGQDEVERIEEVDSGLCDHPARESSVLANAPMREASDSQGQSGTSSSSRPWEMIPDHNWDRKLVKLLHATPKLFYWEIGNEIGVAESTVKNRVWELRKKYGEEIFPRRRAESKRDS